jgi:hypothetical protein
VMDGMDMGSYLGWLVEEGRESECFGELFVVG